MVYGKTFLKHFTCKDVSVPARPERSLSGLKPVTPDEESPAVDKPGPAGLRQADGNFDGIWRGRKTHVKSPRKPKKHHEKRCKLQSNQRKNLKSLRKLTNTCKKPL